MNRGKIGINIGLENVVSGIYSNNHTQIIIDSGANQTIPAYVYYNPHSPEIIVGYSAKHNPNTVGHSVYDILRLVGVRYNDEELQEYMNDWTFTVVNDNGEAKVELEYNNNIIHVSGVDLLCEIFKYNKHCADEQCGNNPDRRTECVISVPSYMNDDQRLLIKEAAERANLKVLNVISSSICANIAYIHENQSRKDKETNLVFDLEEREFNVDIVNTDNINKLSELIYSKYGNEISLNKIIDNVCNYYVEKYKNKTGESLNDKRKMELRRACEESIEYIDEYCSQAYIDVEFLEDADIDTELTLSTFNSLNDNIFKRVVDYAHTAVEESGLSESIINYIILVGCGSRIKIIRELLQVKFKESKIIKYFNPEEICAYGATIIANNSGFRISDSFDRIENNRKKFLEKLITLLNNYVDDIRSNELLSVIKEVNDYVKCERCNRKRNDKFLSKIGNLIHKEVIKYFQKIIDRKPYIGPKISHYLSEDDIKKSIKNLNHLIEINKQCNVELTKGYSVSIIDDDSIGTIKEYFGNDKYLIELNDGGFIKKKSDYILPIVGKCTTDYVLFN